MVGMNNLPQLRGLMKTLGNGDDVVFEKNCQGPYRMIVRTKNGEKEIVNHSIEPSAINNLGNLFLRHNIPVIFSFKDGGE